MPALYRSYARRDRLFSKASGLRLGSQAFATLGTSPQWKDNHVCYGITDAAGRIHFRHCCQLERPLIFQGSLEVAKQQSAPSLSMLCVLLCDHCDKTAVYSIHRRMPAQGASAKPPNLLPPHQPSYIAKPLSLNNLFINSPRMMPKAGG